MLCGWCIPTGGWRVPFSGIGSNYRSRFCREPIELSANYRQPVAPVVLLACSRQTVASSFGVLRSGTGVGSSLGFISVRGNTLRQQTGMSHFVPTTSWRMGTFECSTADICLVIGGSSRATTPQTAAQPGVRNAVMCSGMFALVQLCTMAFVGSDAGVGGSGSSPSNNWVWRYRSTRSARSFIRA